MHRLQYSLLMVAISAFIALKSAPLAAQTYSFAIGTPSTLVTNDFRTSSTGLNIKNGPDSIIDLWQPPEGFQNGVSLVFSGVLNSGTPGNGTTLSVPVDSGLTTVGTPIATVLLPSCPGLGACKNSYDASYAGGGSVFACPNGGPILYFHHGENHDYTDYPNGWTGIGMAIWNGTNQDFENDQQIVGLNLPIAQQSSPISGNPGIVIDPSGSNLYLYYLDEGTSVTTYGCDSRPCPAVASASVSAVCSAASSGGATTWYKFLNGSFSSIALDTNGDESGGSFSPLFNKTMGTSGDALFNVTLLPPVANSSSAVYVGVSITHISGVPYIVARFSTDGISWSAAQTLVGAPPAGYDNTYPRIVQRTNTDGSKTPVLLYVQKSSSGWSSATVIEVPLTLQLS